MKTAPFLALGLAAILPLYAGGYVSKQLITYVKNCKICHGPAYKGAAMETADEWTALFADNAKALKAKHAGDKDATEMFDSSRFSHDAPDMLRFLKANAADSGAVRSCDGLNCG